MFRKVSVFVLVVVFHLLVLGVVYLSTSEHVEGPNKELVDSQKSASEDIAIKAGEQTEGSTPVAKPTTKPLKPTLNDSQIVHEVVQGDYLGKIASKYKVSAKDIMTLNNITNPNKIQLGQKIKIPPK